MAKHLKRNKLLSICISLVLAIWLWVFIMGEESVEVTKKVVLDIKTPEAVTVVKNAQQTITVVLSVPRNLLALLDAQPISVSYDIEDVDTVGNYSFYLKEQDVKRPSQVIRVQQIIPERITISLDHVVSKRLPIVADLVNEPATGFTVNSEAIQVDPNAVLVSGAQSLLEEKSVVYTKPIDIIGRIRSFRKKVILAEDPSFSIENKGLIDVFVPINEEFAQKKCDDVPIKVLTASDKNYVATITPQTISLTLKGPRQAIDVIVEDEILSYIDVVQLETGTYKLPLQITLPTGVSLSDDVPVVEVTIRENDVGLVLPKTTLSTDATLQPGGAPE